MKKMTFWTVCLNLLVMFALVLPGSSEAQEAADQEWLELEQKYLKGVTFEQLEDEYLKGASQEGQDYYWSGKQWWSEEYKAQILKSMKYKMIRKKMAEEEAERQVEADKREAARLQAVAKVDADAKAEKTRRKQELVLPFFVNNKAKTIGCSGITDYYEDENNIYPSYEKASKSFWCKDDKTGKYTLVIDAHPDHGRVEEKCPMVVLTGQDRPAALWSYHHERTTKRGDLNELDVAKNGFVGLDGKPRSGKFFDYQYIASYQGKGYAYICYKKEWLRKKVDNEWAPRIRN